MNDGSPTMLVATDLDGTLLRSDGSVSPRVREAIAAATAADVAVLFVTGRPPQFLSGIAEATGYDGDVLCANGAMLTSLSTMEPHLVDALSHENAVEMTTLLAEADEGVEFRVLLHRAGEAPKRLTGIGRDYLPEIHAHLSDGWQMFKLAVIASDPQATSDAYLESTAALVGHLGEPTHSSHWYPIVEIAAPGVHKGSALARYAAARDLPAERIHAVGDMPNDLPMLLWAGNGYAVANAHRDVLSSVDNHLPANDEDGVAVLLERVISGSSR